MITHSQAESKNSVAFFDHDQKNRKNVVKINPWESKRQHSFDQMTK